VNSNLFGITDGILLVLLAKLTTYWR